MIADVLAAGERAVEMGCGVCVWFCPENAIDFSQAINGQWLVFETRRGPMVHTRSGLAEENSCKRLSEQDGHRIQRNGTWVNVCV